MCGGKTCILRIGTPIIECRAIVTIDDADDERAFFERAEAGGIRGHAIDMREALLVAHDGSHAKLFQPGADGCSKITEFVTCRADEDLERETHRTILKKRVGEIGRLVRSRRETQILEFLPDFDGEVTLRRDLRHRVVDVRDICDNCLLGADGAHLC